MPSSACGLALPGTTRHRDDEGSSDDHLAHLKSELTYADKFDLVTPQETSSPVGQPAQRATASRAHRSRAYRDARDEYARIRELRERSPIAAHLRERRLELGLTQDQVASAAGTSHTAISRLEAGTHTPQLATLRRIAEVLDEELLLCFQRIEDGELEREFAAFVARGG
jgi:DNA-binding XRE family transcriptional regulator